MMHRHRLERALGRETRPHTPAHPLPAVIAFARQTPASVARIARTCADRDDAHSLPQFGTYFAWSVSGGARNVVRGVRGVNGHPLGVRAPGHPGVHLDQPTADIGAERRCRNDPMT